MSPLRLWAESESLVPSESPWVSSRGWLARSVWFLMVCFPISWVLRDPMTANSASLIPGEASTLQPARGRHEWGIENS